MKSKDSALSCRLNIYYLLDALFAYVWSICKEMLKREMTAPALAPKDVTSARGQHTHPDLLYFVFVWYCNVHSTIFKSLCDPGCVSTEGWSDAPTSAGHWPGCLIWCSGSTLCFCSLQERNLKKTPLIPSSFPSLHLILLCVVILPQRVGRSHCWLRLRDISAHLSGPEPPHSGDPGRMLVRRKWWKHLQGQAELLAIPIPSGWFFLLDAMESVVCGIAAVLKFSRDVISSLMGQKGKSCSYFKDWFPTWFLKLHDLYYKIKRITRVRFDGWTMNSWPVSDSLSKCLAVHECHTSMSYWVSISIVVHHFLWGGHFDTTWGVVGGVKQQQELEGVYNHGEINGKSKGKDAEEVANMMIYTVAKCG